MWCVSGPDRCGVPGLALCAHLHQSWGKHAPQHPLTHPKTRCKHDCLTIPSIKRNVLRLGGHHARVPDKEVWRTAHSYLSLRALPLLVRGYQDLSKSQQPLRSVRSRLLLNSVCGSVSSPLFTGGHVLWGHFYQPSSGAEYLPGCRCSSADHCAVHRHRFVCSRPFNGLVSNKQKSYLPF